MEFLRKGCGRSPKTVGPVLLCGLALASCIISLARAAPIPPAPAPPANRHNPTGPPEETAPPPRALMLAPIPLQEGRGCPAASAALTTATGELSLDALVAQVLARNPSLEQMAAAYRAAVAKYPQVTSLDDPMFAGTLGPATIHPDDSGVEFAYRLEISQKVPWPGKRRLRGENALAEARAAGNELEDMRLQLMESAKDAFFEYYLAARALEVNEESLRLLRDFRENAASRFKTGLVPQQDLLQADVEIGREEQRREALERMRRNVLARLNTLMHQPPELLLPPPPKQLTVREALPEPAALRAAALARRPDLLALANRIQADEALLALAHKENYPDVEPFVMYDRFMGNTTATRDLATMVGVRFNLPVRTARRNAAVAEAQARVTQRRAELARETDKVNLQVQQAYDQVRESDRVVRRYEAKILSDVKLNVEAARSAYATGQIPFLTLVEAQRTLVSLRDRYYEAVADYYRRLATLERAAGGPLVPLPDTSGAGAPLIRQMPTESAAEPAVQPHP